jgi:hypothetical protein
MRVTVASTATAIAMATAMAVMDIMMYALNYTTQE